MSKLKLVVLTGIICIALTLVIIYFFIPFFSGTIVNWGTQEIIAMFSAFSIVGVIVVPFFIRYLDIRKAGVDPLIHVELNIKTLLNKYCIFSISIENIGVKEVKLHKSELFIDEGNENELNNNDKKSNTKKVNNFVFPLLTKYNTPEERECDLSRHLCKENISCYPKNIITQGCFHTSHEIIRFSENSVRSLKPKEKFSDDIVIKFTHDGVYRALFISKPTKGDCACTSKEFVIHEEEKEQSKNQKKQDTSEITKNKRTAATL